MRVVLLILLICLAAGPIRAEAPAPEPGEAGRFSMTPTEGGFLRLDRQSGAVSLCAVERGDLACRPAAEERVALEAEIARLTRENAELRAKLPTALPGAEAPPKKAAPSDEELERALSFTERFLRRMMKVFREESPQGQRL